MVRTILIVVLLMASLPSLTYSKADDFISFVDKFAQQPFNLEEKEGIFVYNLSQSELKTLRNTVYARHGYIFDSKDLADFFSSRKWYKPVSKKAELTDVDKKNIDFLLKFEKPEEATFNGYLELFKRKELPIDISDETYGDKYSRVIPLYYMKKYFPMCCPEVRALDKVYINDKFVILLTAVHYAGVYIGMDICSPEGKSLMGKEIARFNGDIAGYTKSNIIIDKDLNITIEMITYATEYDDKAGKTRESLQSKKKEKFHIDSHGAFQKID